MKKLFVLLVLAIPVFAGCNTQSSTNKGKDGKELKLTTPKTVAVAQDDTAKLDISLERKNFDEVVTIKFDKLPDGVTVEEEGKVDKGVKERTFTLRATEKAKTGKSTVHVIASYADMKDTHEVTIEVKEKGTASTSKSSPLSGSDADLKKKRDDLSAALQARMKEVDSSMATLRERAKTADANVKVELNKQIDDLHTRRQDLSKEYDRVQATTAANWNDFSARVTSAANELADGARKAVEKFKK